MNLIIKNSLTAENSIIFKNIDYKEYTTLYDLCEANKLYLIIDFSEKE